MGLKDKKRAGVPRLITNKIRMVEPSLVKGMLKISVLQGLTR